MPLILPRRKILIGLGGLICAPAIVRAQTLMELGSGSVAKVAAAVGGTTFDPAVKGSDIVLSGGNLTATKNTSGWQSVLSTTGKNSGKLYFEIKCLVATDFHQFGLTLSTINPALDMNAGSVAFCQIEGRSTFSSAGNGITLAASFLNAAAQVPNDVTGFAVDLGTGNIWCALNNSYTVYSTGGNPVTATNPAFQFTPPLTLFPAVSLFDGGSHPSALLSASGTFTFAPPTGFSSWS